MRVTFKSIAGAPTLTVLQGGPAQVVGGVGGWEVAPRPKRVGITRWIGRDPLRVLIPILFDSHINDESVEDDIDLLMKLALPGTDHRPPPVFTISGAVPHDGFKFVIDDIEWGTNVLWAERGRVRYRTRQDASVRVLQYVAPDYVVRTGSSSGVGGREVPARYVIQPGDTLASIALKFYGDRNYWRKIAALNRIDDSVTAKLRPGRGIALPRP